MALFSIKSGNDYSKFFQNKKTGFKTGYYTNKEIKALFPEGGTRVAGQIGCGKKEVGALTADGVEEKVYKANSGVRYKTVGYIELENGKFIAVKKDIIALLIIFIILGLLALAGIAFGIKTYIDRHPSEPAVQTNPSPFELDENQKPGAGEMENLPPKIDTTAKRITMRGITSMKLKANQLSQNVILSNPEENDGVCFMSFVIFIDKNENKKADEDDEMIYKSGLVKPGFSVSKFNLLRTLEPGEYNLVILEQPYSMDKTLSPLNNFNVPLTVTVE